MGRILVYYLYTDIENPHEIMKWQRELCIKLSLRGRIYLAHEGVNGTVGGTLENTQAYIDAMHTHPLFTSLEFKESPGDAHNFRKLMIKVRREVVTLGIDPNQVNYRQAGHHLTPLQAHELISANPQDLVILDGRNEFEARIGKFRNAVVPPIKTFKEFPRYIDANKEKFKDKTVIMYCTGGIRCERASAYLKSQGINNVYQLKGGIHTYLEQFPDGHFRGKNYVFDSRVAIKTNDDVIATCEQCVIPYDIYSNCLNASCNKLFIACPPCKEKLSNTCSTECQTLLSQHKVKPRPAFVEQHE